MKRTLAAVSCVALLVGGVVALHAENSSSLSIEPSKMHDGETKTFTDDGQTITVRREGNATSIRVEGDDKTDRVTITREGGRIRIGRMSDSDRRIFVDGITRDIPRARQLLRELGPVHFCPKDQTTLRVPKADEDATFKCPLDGTAMERRNGRGVTFFFDDGEVTHL
jgi:hypothetical protein